MPKVFSEARARSTEQQTDPSGVPEPCASCDDGLTTTLTPKLETIPACRISEALGVNPNLANIADLSNYADRFGASVVHFILPDSVCTDVSLAGKALRRAPVGCPIKEAVVNALGTALSCQSKAQVLANTSVKVDVRPPRPLNNSS